VRIAHSPRVRRSSPTLGLMTPDSRRPVLLWVVAAFWTLSGCLGLLPFVSSPEAIARLAGPVLAFAAAAALTHVLSLVGAGLLVLRKRFALLALGFVFVISIAVLFVTGKSPADLSPAFWLEWGFAAATLAYAALLAKRGVLR
jgi:hypothetical protein